MSTTSAISSGVYFGVTSGFFNTASSSSASSLSLSDYSSIKSGSYYKLMKAYYGGNSTAASLVDSSESTTATAADKKNLVSTRDSASALRTSTAALLQNGSKSVFKKDSSTGEYNTDEIYKSVSSFVEDYNDMVDGAADSSNTAILRTTANMVKSTKVNSDLLAEIGITVKSDNTLSIDKEAFKAADMSKVKSLFNGTGSYAYNVASSASQVYNKSVSDLAQLAGTTYSSTGSYNANYSGSNFSSYL